MNSARLRYVFGLLLLSMSLVGCGKLEEPRLLGTWEGRLLDEKLSLQAQSELPPTHRLKFEPRGSLRYRELNPNGSPKPEQGAVWSVVGKVDEQELEISYGPLGSRKHAMVRFLNDDQFTMVHSWGKEPLMLYHRRASE